jgi:hypothetical protein
MKLKSRVIEQHEEDCIALKNKQSGLWETEWSEFPEKSYFGNIAGKIKTKKRSSGRHVWILFRCNSTSCCAKKIIPAINIINT